MNNPTYTRKGDKRVERCADQSFTVEDFIASRPTEYIVQMAPQTTPPQHQMKTIIFSPEAFALRPTIASHDYDLSTALYGLVPAPATSHQDHSVVAAHRRQDIHYQKVRRSRSQSPSRSCSMQLVEPRYRARSGALNRRELPDTCQFCHSKHPAPFSQARRSSRISSRNLADSIQSLTLEDDPDKMDWTYD
jgi:hypothetical protein